MMPDLDRIYDRDFFAEWGRTHERYVESARIITDVLHNLYKPKRLVDLGAGCGVYSRLFADKGVQVVAVDGVVPPPEFSFDFPVQVRDLTAPFENVWGVFDLALCLEVAEHIPETLADAFLENLARFSDRLLLSAAQPNQGGHHHVNEQPKRYWVAKLAAHGFAYDRKATGRIQTALAAARPPYMWMAEQISVYDKATAPLQFKNALPFSVAPPKSV
jgi:SAM-dependent methyltransferase